MFRILPVTCLLTRKALRLIIIPNEWFCIRIYIYIIPGAYEQKECPTLHYRVERHLNLNDCNTFLIWTYPQVGHIWWSWHKCCYHNAGYSQLATLHVQLIHVISCDNNTYDMTTNGMPHLRVVPYKEGVTNRSDSNAVPRSWRLLLISS